jgi:ABC-type dipeptide/oligopeptide/nickel transport system permease subunit
LLEIMHQMPTTMVLLAIFGFSLGVEAGNQMVLLPLFSLLEAARRLRAQADTRQRAFSMVQRIGSAAVSVAGLYYLCVAVGGAP